MPTLIIDNQEVSVPEGATVLAGARRLGIEIPTLCQAENLPHANACMVCLVRDVRTSQLIPACSYPAEDGLAIDTSSEVVMQARRSALDLLLREHFGDCEAPCRRGCPANMDIPGMMRAVEQGDWPAAATTVYRHIPLPMLLGLICPAPCENICQRGAYDHPLRIKSVKYLVGKCQTGAVAPQISASRGGIAVIGGGPAGASAAAFLADMGCVCSVYEKADAPWGPLLSKLREGTDDTGAAQALWREAAVADYRVLSQKGVTFVCDRDMDSLEKLNEFQEDFDAILLAGGHEMRARLADWGIRPDDTCQTNRPGVFACGSARRDCGNMAVQAIRDAQLAAQQMAEFLQVPRPRIFDLSFDSRAGGLDAAQLQALAAVRSRHPEKTAPPVSPDSRDTARAEAGRCMHCDCTAGATCALRKYALEYGVTRVKAHPPEYVQTGPLLIREHPEIIFEPGKCIRCGLCVRLSAQRGETCGLTFRGRGRQMRLGPPLGVSWAKALSPSSARECAALCPTGAIAIAPDRGTRGEPTTPSQASGTL